MIRSSNESDIEDIMKIWLATNIETHSFIDKSYWQSNYELVKQMIMNAEIYVWVEEKIMGFIGLDDEYIAGLFVVKEYQSMGIGSKLIDSIKLTHMNLNLNVYKKNHRAIRFYIKQEFEVLSNNMDENTGEIELNMRWSKR